MISRFNKIVNRIITRGIITTVTSVKISNLDEYHRRSDEDIIFLVKYITHSFRKHVRHDDKTRHN